MRYVGVDLAWGLRNPTGVAVLDDRGSLIDVRALRTDEQILEWSAAYVDGPCLVAFDAPIVVTNPTGRRPAEALLNARYARFHAGAHPSNLTRPHFRDGTRALGLVKALDLDHLGGSSTQQAIEVYPHPAIVTLFGLDHIIRYKQKPGRGVPELRSALIDLIAYVESLADADPPLMTSSCAAWAELKGQAESATRKFQLRRVEDPVDAVVCAYVALFALRRPADVHRFGRPDEGQIVVPAVRPT